MICNKNRKYRNKNNAEEERKRNLAFLRKTTEKHHFEMWQTEKNYFEQWEKRSSRNNFPLFFSHKGIFKNREKSNFSKRYSEAPSLCFWDLNCITSRLASLPELPKHSRNVA
ncbi:hypothetical protein JTE90_025958 [Oedothorax gibbosus]|uniref:Ycf1 n=1 Tax=Oedothorax gibbosus TaxID=931172 RepID=A0AAV6U2K0_9ARAC|nr:hypothetical protein JTE90_025958 [Oedothorax gibbosus]